jgi:hypothetical protein
MSTSTALDSSNANPPSPGDVIDDPNARVDGQTLTQWVEDYERWTFQAPANAPGYINTVNDPTGSVANALNPQGSQMFFITGAPAGAERTFYVRPGENVLVPVANAVDSEGPGIPPSIPNFQGSYADEVKQVLSNDLSSLGTGAVTLDGKTITPLPVLNTGIFSAGVAEPGSVGQLVTGANADASLQTTGVAGYFVALQHLSPGSHQLIESIGGSVTHIDNIIVGAPTT